MVIQDVTSVGLMSIGNGQEIRISSYTQFLTKFGLCSQNYLTKDMKSIILQTCMVTVKSQDHLYIPANRLMTWSPDIYHGLWGSFAINSRSKIALLDSLHSKDRRQEEL